MGKFIIMSRKEKEREKVYEQLVRKEITQEAASQILGLGTRQIRTNLKRYKNEGTVVHKNRGKPSKKKLDPEKRTFAVELLKSELWRDFGPTFAAEKLYDLHNIKINRESVRQIMREEGIPYEKRKVGKRRKRRERKRMFGIMIQLDGSPHKWFGANGEEYTLLVFIDDATSRIVWLEFVKSESLESVMQATRNYMQRFGRPVSFYVDFGSVFRVNVNNPDHEKLTQFERSMKELGTQMIHAHSPEAKGRVERSNRTHQDRLVKELRLAGIKDPVAANGFLPLYIEKHNEKFAEDPFEPGDAHRSIDSFNLDEILCVHEERVIQNDYTILFKRRVLQLSDKRNIRYKPRDIITVKEKLDGALVLSIRGFSLDYKELTSRPKKEIAEKTYNNSTPHRVSEASRRWNGGLYNPNSGHNQSYTKGLE